MPGVLRGVGVGAGQQEDVVGELGLGRPHLLAVDDPLVAVELGPGLEAGQVAAGVGLAEALAPGDGPVQDPRDELLLLLLGAPLQDGRADQGVAEEVGPQGRLGPGELLVQHDGLHEGEALAAVLGGPRRADPAARRTASPSTRPGTPCAPPSPSRTRGCPSPRAGCRSATGGSRRGTARSRRGSSGPWGEITPGRRPGTGGRVAPAGPPRGPTTAQGAVYAWARHEPRTNAETHVEPEILHLSNIVKRPLVDATGDRIGRGPGPRRPPRRRARTPRSWAWW